MPKGTSVEFGELKKLAELRLKEAKILFQNGFYDGAVYLCGYVVELALKACICKNLGISEYPGPGEHGGFFASHEYDQLLLLAGLSNKITIEEDQQLFGNWSTLTKWKPSVRYEPAGTYNENDASARIKAIEDRSSGFLAWIERENLW